MRPRSVSIPIAGLLWAAAIRLGAAGSEPLKPVSAFSSIADPRERSEARFVEAARVITSPRRLGAGVQGMARRSCHGAANVATLAGSIASIPGSPGWLLAPAAMAWQGRSLREICQQIQDPARNGGRTLAKIGEHMAKDAVVAWAFAPGDGRAPAPGTQAQFGALIDAWIATGAGCPRS